MSTDTNKQVVARAVDEVINSGNLDAVDLLKMIRSGSYAEILHRWSVSDGAVPSITINGGSTAPPNALPKT
jgi:hypothetical protein